MKTFLNLIIVQTGIDDWQEAPRGRDEYKHEKIRDSRI